MKNPHDFRVRVSLALLLTAIVDLSTLSGQGPPRAYPSAKRPLETNAYLPPAPGSWPWAPAWSPDGKWIAIGMSGSIWKVDRSTGVAYELTYDAKYHGAPAWSPDGRWIVYTADDGGRTIQLAAVNVDTGQTQALTDDSYVYTDPAFSPDGSRLAYVSTNPNGYLNVYTRPIKDGRWTGPATAVTSAGDQPGGATPAVYFEPAWTRDGKDLVIVSNRNVQDVPGASDRASSLTGEIIRVPAAGGSGDARTVVGNTESYYRARPDVSFDGTRIVFSSTSGSADDFHNLYLQSLAGGDPAKLTYFAHDAFYPRWSPDGEWIAYLSNEDGPPQLTLLETFYGDRKRLRIVDRRWKRPMGTLSVRTVDVETGATVPARVHLTASDGKFYAPADALARTNRFGDQVFHEPGTFTIAVPVGNAHITAVKGFEFWPVAKDVAIEPGQVTSVTLDLKRMTHLAAAGWRGGSMHAHLTNEGSFHPSIDSYLTIHAGEDEDVVTLQDADYGSRTLDHEYFVTGGGAHPRSTPDRLFLFGQEYRPPLYGHLQFFGLKHHLLSPVRLGGAGGTSLYPTPTDLFRRARAQAALVGYDHAFGGEADPLDGNLGQAPGFLVDAALGTADVVRWNGPARAGFFPLYAAWNNGLAVSAVGGEDSIINTLGRHPLPGAMRTYAFVGGRALTAEAWFDSVRAGHVFVSSGPLTTLLINGRIPGDTITVPAGGGTVQIDATVQSITPLASVVLVCNGAIVADVPLAADRHSGTLTQSMRISDSGWCHLRAESTPADRFPLDVDYAQAFTNPIWIKVGARLIRNRASAEYGIRWIDKLQQIATTMSLWRSPAEKDHVMSIFGEARAVYRRLASEAQPTTARGQ